jgi:hypothetical protein
MTDTLIEKLEKLRVPHIPYGNYSNVRNWAITEAIAIIRQHQAEQSQEMVERVAKALHLNAYGREEPDDNQFSKWETLPQMFREDFIDDAQTAIAAMGASGTLATSESTISDSRGSLPNRTNKAIPEAPANMWLREGMQAAYNAFQECAMRDSNGHIINEHSCVSIACAAYARVTQGEIRVNEGGYRGGPIPEGEITPPHGGSSVMREPKPQAQPSEIPVVDDYQRWKLRDVLIERGYCSTEPEGIACVECVLNFLAPYLREPKLVIGKCSECEGQGWYSDTQQTSAGDIHQVQRQCEACNATGQSQLPKREISELVEVEDIAKKMHGPHWDSLTPELRAKGMECARDAIVAMGFTPAYRNLIEDGIASMGASGERATPESTNSDSRGSLQNRTNNAKPEASTSTLNQCRVHGTKHLDGSYSPHGCAPDCPGRQSINDTLIQVMRNKKDPSQDASSAWNVAIERCIELVECHFRSEISGKMQIAHAMGRLAQIKAEAESAMRALEDLPKPQAQPSEIPVVDEETLRAIVASEIHHNGGTYSIIDATAAIRALRPYLREPKGESVTHWHPIATAPQDGTPILGRGRDYGRPDGEFHYSLVFWRKDHWRGIGNDTTWQYLTDWTPTSLNSIQVEETKK